MIASMLTLDRRAIKSLKIRDAYSIHKLVYSLFPGNQREFLYYDRGGDSRGRNVLILSYSQPLIPEFGGIKSRVVPEGFLDYENYAFQVLVNPVQRRSKDKKLIPITTRESLVTWFIEKQESWGFISDTTSLEVSDLGVQIINKNDETEIVHNKATFRGTMQVTNKEKLMYHFRNGIGRGKAYGFGLLQLQPLRTEY